MTRMPGALWRPISRNYTPRKRRVTRGIILHVAASEATSLYGWFNDPRARASSHLYILRNGAMEQLVDLDYIAWGNGAANSETIIVETQGGAKGPWTPAQVETIIRVIVFTRQHFGYPLQVMRSSRASERGVGWHALGVPATRAQLTRGVSQTGGQLWSRAVGKVCPGPERIAQIPGIVNQAKTRINPPHISQAIAQAGIEIGEEMTNVGIYAKHDGGKTVIYAVFNPSSGFFHRFGNGRGRGSLPAEYNNQFAKACQTTGWAEVTHGHMDVIERACAQVRAGK